MLDCLGSDLQFRLVGGLSTGSIYALIALGYTLVYGVLQLINFAHSEVFMFGTVAGMLFLNLFDAAGQVTPVLFFVAFIPTMLASGLVAVLLERIAYRPLRRRGAARLSYLISAIGASFFLSNLVLIWRGRSYEGYPRSIDPRPLFKLGRVPVQSADVIVLILLIVMLVALDMFVNKTRMGKGIRAVAQDGETAGLMGVDINRVVTITFLVGGLLAGAAALMWGLKFGVTRFDIGFLPGIKAFTAAVLGGIGNIRGAVVGGLLLGLLESIGAGCFGNQWKDVIAFVLLVVVLMFRPTGLLGEGVGQKT
ncbi:MAG TPA: branched-chain amino acid ABC transporter permease [Actinomycetota bacterium]|nr:branched-chain amino acid ABC transporter permease [Actinomycetota bacterium]